MGAKSDNAELRRRVDDVLTLMLSGFRRSQIIKYIAENRADWDIRERMVDAYIQKANALIEETKIPERDFLINQAVARLEMMLAKALNVQDIKTALSVQKEIDDLLGLKVVKSTIDVNHGGEVKTESVVIYIPSNGREREPAND